MNYSIVEKIDERKRIGRYVGAIQSEEDFNLVTVWWQFDHYIRGYYKRLTLFLVFHFPKSAELTVYSESGDRRIAR